MNPLFETSEPMPCLTPQASPCVLAQGLGPLIDGPPPPPALRSPPVLEAWLFEGGILLPVGIAVLGVVGFLTMRSLGRERQARLVGITGLALGVAAWALSAFVTTDRERVSNESRALVAGAAGANGDALDRLLDSEIKLYRGGVALDGKERVLSLVHTTLGGPWKVKSWQILETQAQVDSPTTAMTQMKVRVVPEVTGFPDISWWKVDWHKDGSAWRAIAIEPTAVNDGVFQALPSAR